MRVSSSKTLPAGFSLPILASHQLAERVRERRPRAPIQLGVPALTPCRDGGSIGWPSALQFQVLAAGKVHEVGNPAVTPSPRENKNITIKAGKGPRNNSAGARLMDVIQFGA